MQAIAVHGSQRMGPDRSMSAAGSMGGVGRTQMKGHSVV